MLAAIHRLTVIRLSELNVSRFKFSLFCFTVRASDFLLACGQINYYSIGAFLHVIFFAWFSPYLINSILVVIN